MTDTIAAIATPPGSGALGVVRVSGPSALDCARRALGLESLPPRKATLAVVRDLDHVVATWFPAAQSPTGEDLLEVSAHGSPYILRRLIEAVLGAGARLALPGEFTRRSFLNGKLDLAQAEAVCELIRARTDSAHRAALSQLEGGLSAEIARLREPILDLLVRLEAGLDHPEEDIPAQDADETSRRFDALREDLLGLAGTFGAGRLLSESARVCIVGRPNAGKSSLLNAMLGADRAIVCPAPGTTRDTLEEPADLAGLPVVLVDTAGLREGALDEAERAGIERSERALKNSDLALLVLDGSKPLAEEDRRVHARILATAAALGRPVLTVLNKSDLPPASWAADRAAPCDDRGWGPSSLGPGPDGLAVSALRGTNIAALMETISSKLSGGMSPRESVMVVSLRHFQCLSQAASALEEAREAVLLHPGRWEDRAASRLRAALASLDEITGLGAPDEVLHAVFSRFCVGK